MTWKDAAWFPVIGSVVLGSLFLAIKFLGAYYVNLILNFYFFFVGTLAVASCVAPFVAPFCKSVRSAPSLAVPARLLG